MAESLCMRLDSLLDLKTLLESTMRWVDAEIQKHSPSEAGCLHTFAPGKDGKPVCLDCGAVVDGG